MTQSPFKPTDISFSHVVDMYLSELRGGVELSPDLLAETFPHLAEEIRTQLPALALLERSVGRNRQAEASVPDTIGGCRIIRELGRGAMGIVYEAQQSDINRNVAVKVMPLDGTSNLAIHRFEAEARAMGRVDHPNITPVYSYGHDDQHAYLVMRLVDGLSLYDLQNGKGDVRAQFQMNELRSDWNLLARMAFDVSSGLQHAHEKGLVHRDIKPGNLILDKDGKIWITDFGLAKIFDNTGALSATGDAVGTPRYMAPEQVRGVCDARSDIYSLGLTLYEIAVGKQVWEDRSSLSLVGKRSQLSLPELLECNQEIPVNLAKIIMKCCEFDPSNRYQTAKELQVVLKRYLAGLPKSDRRVRKREPDEVFQKKSRQQMLMATGLFGLVCIATGMWLVWPKASGDVQDSAQQISGLTLANNIDNKSTPAPTRTLVDELANAERDNMLEIVADYVNEGVKETIAEHNYSETAKTRIQNEVEKLTSQIKEQGGIDEQSLNQFLHEYRQTSLPAASRVMRLTTLVQSAPLNANEQVAGVGLIRRLAAAIANNYVSSQEAEAMIRSLVGNAPIHDARIRQLLIPAGPFRHWFAQVERRLSVLPPEAFSVSQALEGELSNVFQRAIEKTSAGLETHE